MCLKFYFKWLVILSLVVAITSIGYAQTVSAQTTSEIKVESSEALSNFPKNVSFKLTTKSTVKLRSIKLFYQINRSSDWTSVVGQFDSRHRITAKFVLNTSGSNFLIPGSTIRYFYAITDENGTTLKTNQKKIKYLDPRFEWNKFTVDPLTVYYHNQDKTDIDILTKTLKVEIEAIKDLFSLKNPAPIEGILYNHRGELANILPDTATIPEIYHGFAFIDQQIFLGIGSAHDTVIHESSHLLLAQAMKNRINPLPAWIHEGISSYLEPSRVSFDGHSLSKQAPPLSAMESVPDSPAEIAYFYRKSESVVSFLINELHTENGLKSFKKFLFILAHEPYPDLNTSMNETFGITSDELDTEWAASFRGLPSPSRGTEVFETPSPFLFLDTWLLGGLAIFVLGIVGIRFLKHKIYPGKDEEYMDPEKDDT